MLMIQVSPGELIDKLTILEIKKENIDSKAQLKNINVEFALLSKCKYQKLSNSPELDNLSCKLKKVNQKLWDIEDKIREFERRKNFGPSFIKLARSVYVNNDVRANLKRKINELLDSEIFEEKSYAKY